MMICKDCVFNKDCNKIAKYTSDDTACCTKFLNKNDYVEVNKYNDLLYVIRTNMTSITRYVRHERKNHPMLTEGQFIVRHLKYKELADVAVNNILEYVNGKQKKGGAK